MNQNFAELIQVSEEVVKRRRLVQEEKNQLVKDKEEMEIKLHFMQKDINRLQANSWALDGLSTLVEAARKI